MGKNRPQERVLKHLSYYNLSTRSSSITGVHTQVCKQHAHLHPVPPSRKPLGLTPGREPGRKLHPFRGPAVLKPLGAPRDPGPSTPSGTELVGEEGARCPLEQLSVALGVASEWLLALSHPWGILHDPQVPGRFGGSGLAGGGRLRASSRWGEMWGAHGGEGVYPFPESALGHPAAWSHFPSWSATRQCFRLWWGSVLALAPAPSPQVAQKGPAQKRGQLAASGQGWASLPQGRGVPGPAWCSRA